MRDIADASLDDNDAGVHESRLSSRISASEHVAPADDAGLRELADMGHPVPHALAQVGQIVQMSGVFGDDVSLESRGVYVIPNAPIIS